MKNKRQSLICKSTEKVKRWIDDDEAAAEDSLEGDEWKEKREKGFSHLLRLNNLIFGL